MHNDDMNEMAKRHTAGAIINHISPFDHLVTHKNDFELTDDFIKKWCIPYYMEIGNPYNTTWQEQVKLIKGDISKEICLALLGDFNWRTRLTGAYFAAVKRYDDMVDIIGTHLVKSELCCVGFTYAMVLAFFNNEKAIHYLRTYLDYYLTTTFAFDQRHVLEALIFLDKENHTNLFDAYWHKWNTFIEKKKAHEVVQAKAMTQALKEQSGFDNTQIIEKLIQRVEEELSTEHITKQVDILKRLHAF